MANPLLQKQRYIAFAFHLLASAVVATLLFLLLILLWFPGALFAATGGLEGITIVLAVDLVLGPLLTFVVYNTTKTRSHLTRDLGVIICLQLSCLFAGIYVVYKARPLALVHVFDTFYVLNEEALITAGIEPSRLEKFGSTTPKILYVSAGSNLAEFAISQISDKLSQATPKHLQIDQYQDLQLHAEEMGTILNRGIHLEEGNCTIQNISSPYRSGTICFNPDTFGFSDFSSDTSLSALHKQRQTEKTK